MMNNLKILEFRSAIKNFVNESPLDDEVKRMVLESLLQEQAKITDAKVRMEIMERDRREKEEQAKQQTEQTSTDNHA